MAQPGGGSVDHGREPCPDRILDDIGGAFGMGAVGGGIWHLIKGAKNSPSGARTRGGIEVRRNHALLFSDCTVIQCCCDLDLFIFRLSGERPQE